MTLHHVDHIVDEQITLGLHDRTWIRTDKQHHKIIARVSATGFVFVVKFGVVKSDLDLSPCSRQLIEVHAKVFHDHAKVIVASDCPAQL